MTTDQLSVRGCSQELHKALQASARANRRSMTAEVLKTLEENTRQPVTGREAARMLREFNKGLNRQDRLQIAEGIEKARKTMANEHLH